ncbi:hypothetical protein Tco_1432515 [Tanacetum coccineum]
MSFPNHPTSNIEDAFSSTNVPNYFLAIPGNISLGSSDDFTKYLLATLVFSPLYDMEVMPAYDTTPLLQTIIALPAALPPSSLSSMSTTPPPDYPIDKSIFAELDNSLWIIPRPLGEEPVPEEPNESDAYESIHL